MFTYTRHPFRFPNLRTPAKLKQAVITQSTINLDGFYVGPATIDIDGLSLTPAKHGFLSALKRNYELLNFGYVPPPCARWRRAARAAGARSPATTQTARRVRRARGPGAGLNGRLFVEMLLLLITLRRAANVHICTLDSGGVLALHT
jgi:hypothetical protein